MALPAVGGNRPGVYAGFSGRQCQSSLSFVSAPFTGLLFTYDSNS